MELYSTFLSYAILLLGITAMAQAVPYFKDIKFEKIVKSYMDILAAGGSKKPEKLLLEHGFDIKSPKFWQEGFDYVSEQVKVLSSLN